MIGDSWHFRERDHYDDSCCLDVLCAVCVVLNLLFWIIGGLTCQLTGAPKSCKTRSGHRGQMPDESPVQWRLPRKEGCADDYRKAGAGRPESLVPTKSTGCGHQHIKLKRHGFESVFRILSIFIHFHILPGRMISIDLHICLRRETTNSPELDDGKRI